MGKLVFQGLYHMSPMSTANVWRPLAMLADAQQLIADLNESVQSPFGCNAPSKHRVCLVRVMSQVHWMAMILKFFCETGPP